MSTSSNSQHFLTLCSNMTSSSRGLRASCSVLRWSSPDSMCQKNGGPRLSPRCRPSCWPAPETVTHLRSFPGNGQLLPLIHARLPGNGSALHRPAQGILCAQKVKWSVECETAFNFIKSTLTSTPVLRHFDQAFWQPIECPGQLGTRS